MSDRVLTSKALNRALLARQSLLERSSGTIVDVVEQVGGLQTQYAPSGYVGLWTRMAGFRRDDLTRALEDRSLVQATLMRNTIHIVSRAEYWRYAMGVGRARREWWIKASRGDEKELRAAAARVRDALADGPRNVKDLGELGKDSSATWACSWTSFGSHRRAHGNGGEPTAWTSQSDGLANAMRPSRKAWSTWFAPTYGRLDRAR